ncbi:MAG: thioesterase domain-containing protein [Myxococcales bacterium]
MEIENQLLRLPGIEACAVKPCEIAPHDVRLVAYVVKQHAKNLVVQELQAALKTQLPDYMIPSAFVELPALPLTRNGKLDRKALLPPSFGDEAARNYEPPRDELETMICRLFEEFLGRAPVGLTDSFFDLGGHSILAVRLFEKMLVQTNKRLPLATLFEAPTPLELSLLVRASEIPRRDPRASYLVPLADNGQSPQLFCVHPDGCGTERALAWYRPLVDGLSIASLAVTCDEDVYLELEELAARHVAAMRRQALPKTLCLLGVGLGGNVAQEMAVQLESEGVEVSRVIAIQSLAPGAHYAPSLAYLRALAPNVRRAMLGYSRLLPHQAENRKLLWARSLQQLLRRVPDGPPALEDPADLPAVPACYQSLSAPQWNALLRHRARPCGAPITLIRGHRSGLTPLDEAHGFGALSHSSVEARILDCSATSLLDHRCDTMLGIVLREVLTGTEPELIWHALALAER